MEIKHSSPKKPENSGASAQVLASLRAEKLRRTPSTIIKHHRAAKALAAARMAAQVALDKLEARADWPAEEIVDLHKRQQVLLCEMNKRQLRYSESERLRAAGLAEDRAVSLHAADLLDHARDQGSTLERALGDFQGESELLGELGDLVLSRAYDIDAMVA